MTRLDGVAAAAGPGLIGGVIVGLTTAKAIALVHEQAADRGQSSRGACADRAADRRHGISLLPVPRLRRPYPDRGRASASAIMCGSAPRSRRCHRRGLRQDRQAAGPRLSRRTAGREARRYAATPSASRLPRPMLGRQDADFSLSGLKTALRLEAEKIAPLSDAGCRRPLRLVPAGGRRRRRRPAARRPATVPRALRRRRPRWSPPAASPPTRRSARRSIAVAFEVGATLVVPPPELCTDNGAMIAWAGCERLALGLDRSA